MSIKISKDVEKQKRVFLHWVNGHLPEDQKIVQLEDLSDGIGLYYLLKGLYEKSGRQFTIFRTLDTRKQHNFVAKSNVNNVLTHLKETEKIKLYGISTVDIVNKKLKIIMALIWSLIVFFYVEEGENQQSQEQQGGKKKLKKVSPYGGVVNFVNEFVEDGKVKSLDSWKNGKPLLELLRALYRPENDDDRKEAEMFFQGVDKKFLDRLYEEVIKDCIGFGERKMNVPAMLTADEFLNPEKKSLITYISAFREYAKQKGISNKKQLMEMKKDDEIDGQEKRKKRREEDIRKKLEEKQRRMEQLKKEAGLKKEKDEKIDELTKKLEMFERENAVNEQLPEEETQLRDLLRQKESMIIDFQKKISDRETMEGNMRRSLSQYENQIQQLQKVIEEKITVEKDFKDLHEKLNTKIQDQQKKNHELMKQLKKDESSNGEIHPKEDRELKNEFTTNKTQVKEVENERDEKRGTNDEATPLLSTQRKTSPKKLAEARTLRKFFRVVYFVNPIIAAVISFFSLFIPLLVYIIRYSKILNYAPPTFEILENSPEGEISASILAFYFVSFCVCVVVRFIDSPLNKFWSFFSMCVGLLLPIGYIFSVVWKIQEQIVLHEIGFWCTFFLLGYYYAHWIVDDVVRMKMNRLLRAVMVTRAVIFAFIVLDMVILSILKIILYTEFEDEMHGATFKTVCAAFEYLLALILNPLFQISWAFDFIKPPTVKKKSKTALEVEYA